MPTGLLLDPLCPAAQEVVALSDDELIDRVYTLSDAIPDDEAMDDFYRLLGEAFERWAPDVEWRRRERECLALDSPVGELEASQERYAERAAARWLARSVEGVGRDG